MTANVSKRHKKAGETQVIAFQRPTETWLKSPDVFFSSLHPLPNKQTKKAAGWRDYVEVLLHGVKSGMAELHLSTPEPFDFKRPDGWTKWKRRFEQFRQASNLAPPASEHLAILEADAVLTSTNTTADERKVYVRPLQIDFLFPVHS